MSKMKHTRAPWINWDTMQWIHEPNRLLTSPANARLMGASPELLKAAKLTLNALEHDIGVDAARTNYRGLYAAVAKAEGA